MDIKINQSIKSRIAALQLEHVGRKNPYQKAPERDLNNNDNQSNSSTAKSNHQVTNPFRIALPIISAQNGQALKRHSNQQLNPVQITNPTSKNHQTIKNPTRPIAPTYSFNPNQVQNSRPAIPPRVELVTDHKANNQDTPLISPVPVSTRGGNETSCFLCIDYSSADAHARKFPRQNVKSIEALAQNLALPFANNPVLKARTIFAWFHHNIAYDTVAFFGGNVRHQTPEETLRTGLAVCQGYAELFAKIGGIAGLEVKVISGHGKGFSHVPIERTGGTIPAFKSNHAWNAVKLNGRWQLVDPCWGAGSLNDQNRYNQRFEASWFCPSPEEFRIRHFPTNPEHQFCSRSISWNEYITLKERPLIYVGFFEKGFNEYSVEPMLRTIKVENKQLRFVVRSHCPHFKVKPEERVVLVLTSGGKILTSLEMEDDGKLWSTVVDAATLKRVTGGNIQLGYIDRLGTRSGKGLTVGEFEREKTRQGYSWTGLARWDVRF